MRRSMDIEIAMAERSKEMPSQRWIYKEIRSDSDARGSRPLREAIADHLRSARGINCDASHGILEGSTQQLVDINARLLLDSGDEIWSGYNLSSVLQGFNRKIIRHI